MYMWECVCVGSVGGKERDIDSYIQDASRNHEVI